MRRPPASPAEPLMFVRRRRSTVQKLGLETVAVLLVIPAAAVITGPAPVDYRFFGVIVGPCVGLAMVVLLALFVLRLGLGRRVWVVVTAQGVGTGSSGRLVPALEWSQMTGLRTVRGPEGRRVVLTRRSGRPVRLFAPCGSAWGPDGAFDRDLAVLRDYAARYGVPAGEDRWGRWRAVLAGMVMLAMVAAATMRVADHGVIWPSIPTAAEVTPACAALEAAGLGRYWPADTRSKARDELDHHEWGDSSYCWWERRHGRSEQAPFVWLTAAVRRHSTYTVSSPIANAITSHTRDRDAESAPEPVSGLGDEAFMTSRSDEVLVAARRSNVTASVSVDLDGDHQQEAETAARELTASILTSIHLT